MALLSHFVILGLLVPFLSYGRGEEVTLFNQPTICNSQTCHFLEASLNINPASIGGAEIAIVDSVALEAGRIGGETFMELGKSGTGQVSIYVVDSGDTLSEIAEMHGVSINTIIWANDLRNTSIKEGQELLILPISGVRHIVKSGDTLQSIAKSYKAELDDILSYNDLSTDSKIKIGDAIIIPNGIISASANIKSSLTQTSSSLPTYSGYYLRPITGGRKSQGIHGYNGVDLAAPTGTPIRASADGTVIIAKSSGYNGGYGLYVVIKHSNGTQTLYAHMSKINVSVGQYVDQGEIIGAVGNTGRSTGPHLHFEVRGARNPF
ncbi:MAG: Metalloendopeptidase-like protein membrane protein [Parcubacteria group bacterium GW2011_GWA2_50_10b]|nr:MAG: Metalloendopeptidase-like protein membrane protein [Parcubacteria group bacterium GW2011_GWA2_50_10b]